MFMRRRWAALPAALSLVAGLGIAPASAEPEPAASAETAPAPKPASGAPHAVKMRRLFTRGIVCALFLVVGAAAGGVVVQRKDKRKN
jgi:hypothetical protein